MKVLVAGASGAIGRPLVRMLLERDHEVVAMTSRTENADRLRKQGAHAVVCDALDGSAVTHLMEKERPDAVIAQLTRLPKRFVPRKLEAAYRANDRVRLDGTRNLLAAARHTGVDRFLAQGSAFWYAPTPGDVKAEEDPLWRDAPGPIGTAVRTMMKMEEEVLAAPELRPLILRYATLYGPGTWFHPDGTVGQMVKKRQYPIVGDGKAVMSFVHVDDAATATVQALDRSVTGVLNIADDEPAAADVWVPEYARILGARPPRRVPVWLARLAIGRSLVTYSMNTRGAANGRAKQGLGWVPKYPSWRDGFRA